MKMNSTVNSGESVNTDRSSHITWHNDHSSRRPKEQISASKNATTKRKMHLSQNAAYSSTYGSNTMPSDQPNANRKWHVYDRSQKKDHHHHITRNSEEQTHKSVDTRDINLPRRRKSKSCVKWCLNLCRAKKRHVSQHILRKRHLVKHIKKRSKEKPNDVVAVAGVSTMPHRESIRHRDVANKSRRPHKQDEAVKEDIVENERKERRERREEKEERRRKEVTDKERRKKVNHKLNEHVPPPVDTRPVTHDDDLVVKKQVPMKPPSIVNDFTKSCCYLCAQNTLAIAAATAISKPEQSDKGVQVLAHKFPVETSPALDKSSSPLLLVHTVQSSVKVRTQETGTLCPGTSAVPRAKKHKKFAMFLGLTRTKCPAGRHAACETDKSTARRDDNTEKRQPTNERCCGKKNA
ncbi:PREDICTED: DNA ligase 1-like [Trachymyrmex septentrionalis]|uniref:DNA ligase 1-like n=1 Tax=Trachymyrmex septentrionalis TaxID=34720 RepID=UPI00084EE4E3|nr:PREDICTED: DNA ligase 1-like [Trachymyrmex septentrionalis]